MIKKLIVVIILIILIVAGIRLIKHKKAAISKTPPPTQRLMAVKTVTAEDGEFPIRKILLGEIVAKRQVNLAARITSHILTVSGRPGTVVKKGDLLIQLDDRPQIDRVAAIRADLAAAETQLTTQSSIFSRDRKLFAAKAISQEAFDKSRASHDSAGARVTALQKSLNIAIADLSYTVIKAPAAGIITSRKVDPGDLATPGKALLGLEETGAGYYVLVNVPQADFARLRPGNQAEIIPDKFASGATDNNPAAAAAIITAPISRVHPAISRGTLASLEIDLSQPPFQLPTGATVRVALLENKVKGWKVPARALLENVEHNYVFTVTPDNRVHIVSVTILAKNGDWLVIAATLDEKNRLIVAQESALLRLHENQAVQVVK
jgi:RND family efflux transporter MFP subunit